MKIHSVLRGLASSLAFVGAASCADTDLEPLGVATAEILAVPTDVNCLDIAVTGGTSVTRRFAVTPGASATLTLRGLPVGAVTIAGTAYATSCRNVTATTEASWVSPAVRATLGAGVTTAVTLPLYRAPTGTVSVDFRDAGAVACGPANLGDCDGDPVNGCETNLSTNVLHCGACGAVCRVPNATQVCAGGLCAVGTCAAGYGNCDAMATNGCEINLNTDLRHCGACGRACSFPNATAQCAGGACTMGACNPGFVDCDGNLANGCEAQLANDATNCGACGNRCGTDMICQFSECIPGNQTLATAKPIDLSGGAVATVEVSYHTQRFWLDASSAGDLLPSTSQRSLRLFYSFTLTRPELVHVSGVSVTHGDAELCFVRSVEGSTQRYVGRGPDETVCLSGFGAGATASFAAGTWYLVVGLYEYGIPEEEFAPPHLDTPNEIAFALEHLPVGNAVPIHIDAPTSEACVDIGRPLDTTSGTGAMSPPCAAASGPELSYWWLSDRAIPLVANTCGADFDTVLTYASARGMNNVCVDDAPALCSGGGSSIATTLGGGLTVVTVDGRGGASGHPRLNLQFGTCGAV